jgi:hypothetical protein
VQAGQGNITENAQQGWFLKLPKYAGERGTSQGVFPRVFATSDPVENEEIFALRGGAYVKAYSIAYSKTGT